MVIGLLRLSTRGLMLAFAPAILSVSIGAAGITAMFHETSIYGIGGPLLVTANCMLYPSLAWSVLCAATGWRQHYLNSGETHPKQ